MLEVKNMAKSGGRGSRVSKSKLIEQAKVAFRKIKPDSRYNDVYYSGSRYVSRGYQIMTTARFSKWGQTSLGGGKPIRIIHR